ncbi:MAG TPA: stage 0 sporulation family protein [Anaerovoracaceae bacterium]|nr:stage 0 sporulation family protein [Anaerovoracaceae bacterium]
MIEIVGIRFMQAGKIYYFDPTNIKFNVGDKVVVETARGLELGDVVLANREVGEDEIVQPLKTVERIATDKDIENREKSSEREKEAFSVCKEKIIEHKLDMKLIDVEYTIDNTKVVFYFTADGRVDFRELVKDLASYFKMRIELRQVGVRDESKMLGGIGACGRPLCCNKWLADFQPVSIKMAKTQNLSLNPAKISGVCGRLMCCLNYENDVYSELRKGMPNVDEKIKTNDGTAKVISINLLKNDIKARLVEKDKETGEEKLSTDVYAYKKEDIKRIDKKKKNKENIYEEVDEETLKEIKELIKD